MSPPVVKRPSKRAPRADAARNRARLVAVALEMFAESGVEVSVEQLAARAEVGIGTLYRHFPTKDALIAAIVVERFEQMSTFAESVSDTKDPLEALAAVLERLVAEGAAKKDLVQAIGGRTEILAAGVDAARKRFKTSVASILSRAQRAGRIRNDVTISDVIALVHGISIAGDTEKARLRRLSIVLDGLQLR